MSEKDLEKLDALDPELRALLDSEAKVSDMPADAPAKLFAKVSAGLGLPGGSGGGGGGGEGGGGAGAGTSAASTTHSAATTAWSAAKTATLIAFGAGTVVGVVGHVVYEQATDPVMHQQPIAVLTVPLPNEELSVPKPTASVANINPLPTTSNVPTSQSSTLLPKADPKSDPKSDDTGDDQDLAAERTQLEVARTALARGQAYAALTTLRTDAAKRPKSRLAEERDSLMIQALALTGSSEEAVRSVAAFKKKYPKSLFLPVVEAALAPDTKDARDK